MEQNCDKETYIMRLRRWVEESFGCAVTTSRDFEELHESIFRRTGEMVSATTLKRLWGYLNEDVEPRRFTLDVLSRYAGWPGWETFCSSAATNDIASGPIGGDHIDVAKQLRHGDSVTLTWSPGRVCRVKYLGDRQFEVTEAKETRLKPGDRFSTSHIIANVSLYLYNLRREGNDLGTYVCGCRTGIRFAIAQHD